MNEELNNLNKNILNIKSENKLLINTKNNEIKNLKDEINVLKIKNNKENNKKIVNLINKRR